MFKYKNNKLLVAFLALCVFGILLSAYLWYEQYLADSEFFFVPCTNGGCEQVLTSEYSKILNVPISAFGFFFYCFLALLSFLRLAIKEKLLDKLFYLFVGWGLLFSLYLRYLEIAKIGNICAWCWVSFIVIIAMCIMATIEYRRAKPQLA